jgi:hypothetical protein
VHYDGRGERNYAAVVRSARQRPPEAGRSLAGIVTAATPSALTVEVDQQSHTFEVHPDTVVQAPQEPAKKPALDALVGTWVLVYYRPNVERQVALGILPLPERR